MIYRCIKPYLLFLIIFQCSGCATKGLITDRFDTSFYHIPSLLPESPIDRNPTFIVYGDTQPAWRIYHKFLQPDNWWTPRMFIFPFYELCWLRNGVRGIVNRLRLMPDYGRKTRVMMRDAVYAAVKDKGYDFILNTGDNMGQDGRRPAQWAIFLRENMQEHPLLREIPYVPTPGNHERAYDQVYGRHNYTAVFDYPHFFVLEFPDAALFIVDSNVIIDYRDDLSDAHQDSLFREWFISENPAKPGWLERELKRCVKPFKIVSIHHSPLTFGYHWKDWYKKKFGPNTNRKRKRLVQLFQGQGVQVVFSGHDHIYQHNVLQTAVPDSSTDNQIHFIVSSGGGVPLRSQLSEGSKNLLCQRYLTEGFNVQPIMIAEVFHYCVVNVNPDTMRIQTYAVDIDRSNEDKLVEEITVPKPQNYTVKEL